MNDVARLRPVDAHFMIDEGMDPLEARRRKLAADAAILGHDERDAAARAVDIALELVAALADNPRQPAALRVRSRELAGRLEPYLRLLNQT